MKALVLLVALLAVAARAQAGSTVVTWRHVGLQLGADSSAVRGAVPRGGSAAPSLAGWLARAEAVLELQYRSLAFALRDAVTDSGLALPVLVAPRFRPFVPGIRAEGVSRPPRALFDGLTITILAPPASAGWDAEAATLRDVVAAERRAQSRLAQPIGPAAWGVRRDELTRTFERARDAFGTTRVAAALDTLAPPAGTSAHSGIVPAWAALDSLELVLLSEAGASPPELADAASWLASEDFVDRGPDEVARSRLAHLLRLDGSSPDSPAPEGTPARSASNSTADRAQDAWLDASVYDLSGRCVRHALPIAPSGEDPRWDGRDDRGVLVARGLYFVRLASERREIVHRVLRTY